MTAREGAQERKLFSALARQPILLRALPALRVSLVNIFSWSTRELAGYSQTPVSKKLGIKPGHIVLTMAAPPDYRAWLAPLLEGVSYVAKPKKARCDIVHVFVPSLAELTRSLPLARNAMKPDGAIWISWVKKSAKIPTDVTEDEIRRRALATDLVTQARTCS